MQQDAGRLREETDETVTTGETRRAKRRDGRGRGNGSENGTEIQVNETTLITGTKQSTGIAETKTESRSPLMTDTTVVRRGMMSESNTLSNLSFPVSSLSPSLYGVLLLPVSGFG